MNEKQKSSHFKLDLLSKGIDFNSEPRGIGNYVKEEYRALFDARLSSKHNMILPPEIVLPGKIVSKTIYRPNSPYLVVDSGKDYWIIDKNSGKEISQIQLPPRPIFYDHNTSRDTPMKQIGQLLGLDCMGIIINSYCARGKNNKHCKFCNINSTTGEVIDKIRNLEEIVETVTLANEKKEFSLVNLTGGTFSSPEEEFKTYLEAGKKIREIMGKEYLPGVSSINPPTEELLKKYEKQLKEANFDLVTYNLEVWDNKTLKKVCPGKYDLGGREHYIKMAKKTSDILGKGHSGIIFTVGPWESTSSIKEGVKRIASEGILPIPVVFHPGKGAEYSWMGTTDADSLLDLFQFVYEAYQENDLIPETRARAAGSEKSFRNSLINEAVMGYLN